MQLLFLYILMKLKLISTAIGVSSLLIVIFIFYPPSLILHLSQQFYSLKSKCQTQLINNKINVLLRYDQQVNLPSIFQSINQTQYFFLQRPTQKQITNALTQLTNNYHLDTIHFITIISNANASAIHNKISSVMNSLSIPQSNYVIRVQPFRDSVFQENLISKFNDPDYTHKIIKQFIKSPYMSQCRYTYLKCTDYLIYQAQNYNQHSYYESENVYIVPNLKHIKEILYDILDILPIITCINIKQHQITEMWYKIQYALGIAQMQSEIEYLEYIKDNTNYYISSIQQEQKVNKWIQQCNKFIQEQSNEGLWMTHSTNIRQDQNIGRLNLFPTDYLVGIYVPILVTALYPLIAFIYYLITNS